MHDAVQFEVFIAAAAVIQQHHGAVFRSILFERQDLPAIPKGILGQHTNFRERVNDEARGPAAVDLSHDGLNPVLQFDFSGMKDCVLSVGSQILFAWPHLQKNGRIDVQAVRSRDAYKFVARLRERDVQDVFAAPEAFGNKLKPQSGFPCSGLTFNQIEMAGRKPATKNIVEACASGTAANTCRNQSFFHVCLFF